MLPGCVLARRLKVRFCAVTLLIALATTSSIAQSHDHAAMIAGAESPYAIRADLRVARYASRLFEGSFSGLGLGAAWQPQAWSLAASVMAYRITRNGEVLHGLGDLVVKAAWTWTRPKAPWMVQPYVMVGIPTSDGDNGLGMGHAMFMSGVTGTYLLDRVTSNLTIGAGYALGPANAHAPHGVWPLVDPMNAREVSVNLNTTVPIARRLRIAVDGTYAVPWPGTDGFARALAALSIARRWRTFELGLGLSVGGLNHPVSALGSCYTAYLF